MSAAATGIELSFREIVSFYDNLLKLVHDLQDLMNNKEKTKLDMFNDIDVVLKKVSEDFARAELNRRQLTEVKRQLEHKNRELQRYRERELQLVSKVNSLQNMNNRLVESLEQTLKKRLLKERPKDEEPMPALKLESGDE